MKRQILSIYTAVMCVTMVPAWVGMVLVLFISAVEFIRAIGGVLSGLYEFWVGDPSDIWWTWICRVALVSLAVWVTPFFLFEGRNK